MSSEYSGETASAASASWSWWTLCVFTSGIFFGTVIAGMFLYWKSSLQAKFRALLGCLLPSSHSHPNPAGHQDTASGQPMDSDIIQDSPLGQEETAPTHPLDSNIVQGSPSSQEDSASTHLQSRPPSPQRGYKYDVFISFRDTDPCNKFIDNLCRYLDLEQISTFKNGKRLEEGEPISPDILQAIRDSKISIVVFSRDYAVSTGCLEEMAAIVDCQKEFGQVVPVFYDVDPSDVRNQSGMYENAFILHTEKFKEDPGKVDRWKTAMTCLGNLSGLDARDKPEHIVIENMTKWLLKALVHKVLRSADDLVGIQPCVEELEKHLKLSWEDDGFQILGICGMGGVGKTTYAMALYDKIFHQFDACCFIQNVSQIYRGGDVVAIQKQILSQTSNEQNLEIFDPFEISRSIRKMLSSKRVLIVLDDVDELEQLEKLAISTKLLGSGSRIIVITRDEQVLKAYGADIIYRVPLLNDNDAFELFLRKAFNSKIPDDNNYVELIPKILEYAQNLPIAIEVLGSFLRDKDVIHWENVLERKRNFSIIEEAFQKSFEELRSNEKEIFLHIACFFHGEKEESVKQVLDSCGLYSHTGIQVIKDKSLITIRNGEIHMHEMLQELGRKIVQAKCPEKPGSWSRLWLYKDFESVLMSEMGTNHVKAVVLNEKEDISKCAQLGIEGLSKMGDLQLLILYHINFSGELKHLSNNLRYLLWHGCPFSSLPLFEPYSRLVELNLPNSSIERLWKGHKAFPYLERVDLSNSEDLMETPNFEGCPNLQRLNFTGCTNLKLVDSSIGLLTKLKFLLLRGCTNLDDIPDSIYNLTSLATLDISGCKILGNLKETKFKVINQQEHGLFDLSLHVQPIYAAVAAAALKSSPSPPTPLTSLADCHHHKVNEELERVLRHNIPGSMTRSPSLRIQALEQPSNDQLVFNKKLSLPIFTGSRILDIDGNPIHVVLGDKSENQMVQTSLPHPIKLELVVLDGDFPPSENETWTSEEFNNHIVKERTGKRPLLTGELNLTLRDGHAPLTGDIAFTDNSSWIRSRKFRVAVRVAPGSNQGVRIREGMTEAFVVKDHRGELYKKHHPPMLHDEVWRLEKIGKDGAFHKKLSMEGINSVQDFLKLSVVDPHRLRKILGVGMSQKMWDVTIKHAETCSMGNKLYVYRGPNFTIYLNATCQLIRADIGGQIFPGRELNNMNRSYIEKLVREAYDRWNNLEEIDGPLNDNVALLTQGETSEQFQINYGESNYSGEKSREIGNLVPGHSAQAK